jgi:ABC-2 type transport system permease protein
VSRRRQVRRGRPLAVSTPWAVVIRSFAFLRKEVVEILRQPKLVALLVLGPFLLMLLFGFSYSESDLQKRALFVGPPGSIYEQVLDNYDEQLSDYIDNRGMVESVDEARAALDDGEVDVVVVFPARPLDDVLNGERSVVEVLHDEIDPIQEVAIEFAARLAIQEVNATVLSSLAGGAQSGVGPVTELGQQIRASNRVESWSADPVATRDQIRGQLALLSDALDRSETIVERLDTDEPELAASLERTRRQSLNVLTSLEQVDANTPDSELQSLSQSVEAIVAELDNVVVIDPDVLVRPFENSTKNVIGSSLEATDYFTPASLSLLLQHLALTFAALSLVRDRSSGLFELMRVGPLSSIEIIIGKIFAYLLVGTAVGAALVAAAVFGLGISMTGSIAWLATIVVLVLLASLALGMCLAIISGSQSQAVQYAMLALLAGLFFSGFILPLSGLEYPVRVIAYLLPVTYGIDTLQSIMLRGESPQLSMVAGLGALVAGYGTLAVAGLRRRLRVSAA